MRLSDLSDGSIKTLLILGLILANIAVAFSHRNADAQPPGSARDPRAGDGDPPSRTFSSSPLRPQARFGESPKPARESRALPELKALART